MLAAGLTLLLFLFWGFLGYALVSVLQRRHMLRNMLLAPSVGTAVCVIPVFWLNRAGFPISKFGPVLALVLIVAMAILWRRQRIVAPFRRYSKFAILFLAAFLIVAWPMFQYGFNWVSISNDDMANYCLTAQRLFNNGYFDHPPLEEITKNTDISAFYITYVDAGTRMGSELLLAFVMSFTRLSPHHVFMPVIIALHLSLLSAAGALFLQHHKLQGWALMALAILSCSAEFSLGTLYQLIAQVFGLGLLAACAVLFLSESDVRRWPSVLRRAALIALLFSSSIIVYPEMIPFLGISCLLFWSVQFAAKRSIPSLRIYAAAALITVCILNTYGPLAMRFFFHQARAGSGRFASALDAPITYPYFLLPSGLAHLWGLVPINRLPQDPVLSVAIAAGALLLLLGAVAAAREAWGGMPAAFISLGMLVSAVVLAFKGADYGLFKIAMFIQPFLIPTLVGAWMRVTGARQNAIHS